MGNFSSKEDLLEDKLFDIKLMINNLDRRKNRCMKRYKQIVKNARKHIKNGDIEHATILTNSAVIERRNFINIENTVNNLNHLTNHLENNIDIAGLSKSYSESFSILSDIIDSESLDENVDNIDTVLEDINVKLANFGNTINISALTTNIGSSIAPSNSDANELLEKLIVEENIESSINSSGGIIENIGVS